jgi:hypothetical protein
MLTPVARIDDDATDGESARVQVNFAMPAALAYAVRLRAHDDDVLVQEWVADAIRAALERAAPPAKANPLPRPLPRPLGHYGDP